MIGGYQMRLLTRRRFLQTCGLITASRHIALATTQKARGVLVNDTQTGMNPTYVSRVFRVRQVDDVIRVVKQARNEGLSVSVCGARHASGGQQFGSGSWLLDSSDWGHVLNFDPAAGTIEVTGGTEWPRIMSYYLAVQKGNSRQWGIAQKQGGLDGLTMGGTLSANAHGHTLTLPPIVHDVESFDIVDEQGEVRLCSRESNAELFRLAIGGYGLFGIISKVKLRLIRRQKLRRSVRWAHVEEVVEALERQAANGSLYGDFQFSIDDSSPDFMARGILTTYDPAPDGGTADDLPKEPSASELERLLYMAHVDKRQAFRLYAEESLASSGELVWSDTHQYSPYPRGYHARIDRRMGLRSAGSDPLVEMYIPRARLAEFAAESGDEMRRGKINLIYSTVRLIKRDEETFMPWARQDYACVIFTIHTDHSDHGLLRTTEFFRSLIDMAIKRGGSYYLTYNRFGDRKRVEAAHPNFAAFLRLKKKYDPQEIFQSDWYRYYLGLFSEA